MQTLSEQGCTGAASADILAAVHGARVLCLLFSPELFILSICVTLSPCNGTTEMGVWMLPSRPPLIATAPCCFQVSFLSVFTHLSSHLSVKRGTCLLLGGWVKPASRQLRDNRPSQLHLKIRPIDLFQKLHSNSDCLSNYTAGWIFFSHQNINVLCTLARIPWPRQNQKLPGDHDNLASYFRGSHLEFLQQT